MQIRKFNYFYYNFGLLWIWSTYMQVMRSVLNSPEYFLFDLKFNQIIEEQLNIYKIIWSSEANFKHCSSFTNVPKYIQCIEKIKMFLLLPPDMKSKSCIFQSPLGCWNGENTKSKRFVFAIVFFLKMNSLSKHKNFK